MTAELRVVDCDVEWDEYVACNLPLRAFPHLRPGGRRSVPVIAREVPRNALVVVLVSGPGGRAHAVLGAIVRELPPGETTYTARSPIDDHRRPGSQYADDAVKLAALDDLVRLFSRQRVRVVYLRGTVAGTLARTTLPRGLFEQIRADYDRYYRAPRDPSRGFECSTIEYSEGPGVVEYLRNAVIETVAEAEALD